ncbi:MAG TPA: phosphate-starvation-inducible PsiE family protein [Candidatus Binataceae bacterium]|nr:phosphate-starvation-inducible PsiE family protein [Candidatus Binataceae bacterium]
MESPAPTPPGMLRLHSTLLPALETADAVVYALVGVVFLVAALAMLGYSVLVFPANLAATGFALAIVTLVNDLLLVMIIMEVLRTVLSYIQERGSSLQPFLFIAAISATRRILAIGAQMSVAGERLSPEQFRQAMIDLAANAGAILAIAAALYLLARRPHSSEPEPQEAES